MKEDKEKEYKDWSSFENTIDELYKSKAYGGWIRYLRIFEIEM